MSAGPEGDRGEVARVRITHVYHGPAALRGEMFSDFSSPNSGLFQCAWPALEKGEKGIWQLVLLR